MQLVVQPNGLVRCVYAESIDLHALGQPVIARGSHVEPDEHGQWLADLSPVDGPCLGPFRQRSDALHAESDWLGQNWLTAGSEF